MTWKSTRTDTFVDIAPGSTPAAALRVNENCFIRKQHRCGKIYGASKSCFIACPTGDDLDPIIELMSEKLTKVGIEPIIAVRERAYGQDILCTKICGKIIEARFCIVILDDAVSGGQNIPNPNVYYEYGLMTSLAKHIVPLQKEGLKLAFNIQSYDTVKYNSKNIGSELDRAIRDAVRITEAQDKKEDRQGPLPDKRILHRFDRAGLQLRSKNWFLNDAIADTEFKGFGHNEKMFYVLLGRVDSPEEVTQYLEDLDIALYRTQKRISLLEGEIVSLDHDRESAIAEVAASEAPDVEGQKAPEAPPPADKERAVRTSATRRVDPRTKVLAIEERIKEKKKWHSFTELIYIGFIIHSQIDCGSFMASAQRIAAGYNWARIVCSEGDQITFGDVVVSLSEPGE
jgi:hypothetical protein